MALIATKSSVKTSRAGASNLRNHLHNWHANQNENVAGKAATGLTRSLGAVCSGLAAFTAQQTIANTQQKCRSTEYLCSHPMADLVICPRLHFNGNDRMHK